MKSLSFFKKAGIIIVLIAVFLKLQSFSQSCLSDNFDSGIDMSQWNTVTGAANTNCGSVSGNALYFDGFGTREARSKGLNVTAGGTIDFYIKLANGTSAPCEDVNSGEDVRLEYSINGGTTWDSIRTYYENWYSTFTSIAENIPSGAWSSNTIFRWRQLANSGTGTDNWALDDVSITCTPDTVPPTVKFSASSNFICNGLVTFYDSSCCNITSRVWQFGDGTTDTSKNPSHIYSVVGSYSVTLSVINAYGSDTLTKINFIVYDTTGPVAASCTPNTLANCCGYGIYNVKIGGINNSSGDGSNGYEDFICKTTSLTEGKNYSISIQTGPNEPENTRVWIDFNNDGTLSNSTELVFSSNNAFNPSGTVSIPSGKTLNTPLRMRISSDDIGNSPTPCSNLNSSQAEDYTVILMPNTDPPATDFKADDTASCDGVINFTDLSGGVPTSWLWSFSDGTTDTVQNPTHTYSSTGMYTIVLQACNIFGCNTKSKIAYIKVNGLNGGPVAPSCSPITTAYCCGYGIYNVNLNGINNTTNNGIDSYKDYSCANQSTIIAGVSYPINIRTGNNNNENVSVWIDYNNNGVFDATGELAFSSFDIYQFHSGNIIAPGTAVDSIPLRMRVSSDNSFSPALTPCGNVQNGQVEDYAVIILPNTNPPVAKFKADKTTSCNGSVIFTDTSSLLPTSWLWTFGDGTTSTLQNPTHIYSATGNYTVKLKVCNANGCDSVSKTNYINVNALNGPKPAPCIPTATAPSVNYGIMNITLSSINNTTTSGNGYVDYSCSNQTTLIRGVTYTISVETGTWDNEDVRAWIDYNNNGVFDVSTETIFSSDNTYNFHSGNFTVPANTDTSQYLRMRVVSDYAWTAFPPSPCVNVQNGQFEDYGIKIVPNTYPPIAKFTVDKTISCGGSISFTDTSAMLPDSWLWTFGDGSTSTAQNPTHTYTTTGNFTVKLKVCNSFGCDSVTKNNYITVSGLNGPKAASCTPTTLTYCCGMGIYNVTLKTINNSTNDGIDGYVDYSCTDTAVLIASASTAIDIETGISYNENVAVWIDYNNDGSFNNSTEIAFSSFSGMQFHSGNIVPPATAVKNTFLRMRVASDYDGSNFPIPCNDVDYGQVEDYAVKITTNTLSPTLAVSDYLDIHPIPTSSDIYINYEFEGEKNLEIIINNILGQEIFTEKITANKNYKKAFDFSQYTKGVYLLKISDGKQNIIRKIITK